MTTSTHSKTAHVRRDPRLTFGSLATPKAALSLASSPHRVAIADRAGWTQLAAAAAFVAQPGPAFADLDVPAMRAGIAQSAQSRTPGPAMDLVIDLTVGNHPARFYRPTSTALPVLLYLHGGGWTIGSRQSHDPLCRRLAAGSGAAVLALDYRLVSAPPDLPTGVASAPGTRSR